MCKKNTKLLIDLISFCDTIASKFKKKIFYEFGTEDHGTKVAIKKFKDDAVFFSDIKNKMFLVGQTGLLIKEIYQVWRIFDNEIARNLAKISKKYDLFVKEHNCDYLTSFQIKERREAGINAINVAPELGYLQTKTTIYLADKFNIKRLLFNYKI